MHHQFGPLFQRNALSDLVESVQKTALKIAYPTLSYEEALQKSNFKLLSTRREEACKKLINSLRDQDSPYNPITAIVKSGLPDRTHNHDLRNNKPQLLGRGPLCEKVLRKAISWQPPRNKFSVVQCMHRCSITTKSSQAKNLPNTEKMGDQ